MDKKKLLRLRKLNATTAMMTLAGKQISSGKGYWKKYKYGMFLRCQYLQGILKVAVFFVEDMKVGDRKPRYEIFCNPEGEEWITYECNSGRWLTAMINNLERPSYTYNAGIWINQDSKENIKALLKTKKSGYHGILTWQQAIRGDQLKERYRRETEPWDLKQEQVPDLPKDWKRWSLQTGSKYHYIFYDYDKNGAKIGYCTCCQREVPIVNPKYNQEGTCKKCRKKVTFKSRGKAGSFYSPEWRTSILQKCEDGFVMRIFRNQWRFKKGEYEGIQPGNHEIRRIFYDENLSGEEYYWEDYKNREMRWVYEGLYAREYYRNHLSSKVYGKTIPDLERGILKHSGLSVMLKAFGTMDVPAYLDELRRHPGLEQIAKAGLTNLAMEQLYNYGRNTAARISGPGELHKKLGITKEQFRMMQRCNLKTYAMIGLRSHLDIQDDVAILLDKWEVDISEDTYNIVTETGLKINKVIRYLERQRLKHGKTGKETLNYYKDYLSMARERGMDITDEIVCLQPDMMKFHNRYLEDKNRRANEKRCAEVNKRFGNIRTQYLLNKSLFEYEDEELIVVVPKCAGDIVIEGMLQHHCVGASDLYMKAMDERKSFIVFLRKKEEQDIPYYTVEISREAKVLQSYAAYDRRPDSEKILEFEKKWIVEVHKRMTKLKEQEEKESQQEVV